MKKILCVVLALAMLLCLCACDYRLSDLTTYQNFIKTIQKEDLEEEESTETIKIGILEPLTGELAEAAKDEIDGIELAHKLFPKVLDTPVELIYADNQSDVITAPQAAQELIDAGCNIVIGSYGNLVTLAFSDIFEAAQIPVIMPTCTNPLLTTTTDYFFRICVVDAFQGNSAAKYVIEYLPSVLHPPVLDNPMTEEDESSEGGEPVKCIILKQAKDERAAALIERFQAKMESEFGGESYSRVIEYPQGMESLLPYLERLVDAGAEAVFFPSTAEEGERILLEAYDNDIHLQWIGDSDWEGLLQAATDAGRENLSHLDGVAYVTDFDNDIKADSAMTNAYFTAVKTYYENDNPGENLALGFDAYLVALEGIRGAGSAKFGSLIRGAIADIREMDAATGSITFQAGTGDPVKDVVIEKIRWGKTYADYVATPNFGN